MPTENAKKFRTLVPPMNDLPAPPGNGRRGFLRSSANAGLLGAAFALLARAAPVAAVEQDSEQVDDQPASSGYHETEHIRKYYAKARQF